MTTGDTNSSQGTGGYSGNNQPPTCPTGPDAEASAHCGERGTRTRTRAAPRATPTTTTARCCGSGRTPRSRTGPSRRSGRGRRTRSRGPAPRDNGPNLFDGSEGGGGKTRPEIFAMGLRNPSRLSIDTETDTVYSAWVGPDAGAPSATLGPSTYENAAQITRAGNYGWPYCMGSRAAYRDRLAQPDAMGNGIPRTENGPGYVSGGPANGGTDGWYDCDNLVNDSIRNTGLTVLPHQTGTGRNAGAVRGPTCGTAAATRAARTAARSSRERGVDGAPNYGAVPRQLCPYATANGATIMNGPLYRYDDDAADNSVRWPAYWDGRWFLHNHGGASIKHGLLLDPATDQDGGQPVYADSLRNTLTWQGNYMDSKFGPDGALYVQVYDGFFRANPNVGLYRYDYVGGPDTPAQTRSRRRWAGAGSRSRSGGRRRLVQASFGDGGSSTPRTRRTATPPPGAKQVTLTVTYADGERSSRRSPSPSRKASLASTAGGAVDGQPSCSCSGTSSAGCSAGGQGVMASVAFRAVSEAVRARRGGVASSRWRPPTAS